MRLVLVGLAEMGWLGVVQYLPCLFLLKCCLFPVWAIASNHQNITVSHKEIFQGAALAAGCYDGDFCCWSGTSQDLAV